MPRTVEFVTALGDAVNRIYLTDAYTGLERITGPVEVVVSSPNPGVKELFSWHPNRNRITVREVPFYGTWGAEHRKKHGIEGVEPDQPRSGGVKFYPNGADELLLNCIATSPYILFSAAAGTEDRNIPEPLVKVMAQVCVEAGYHVVLVGKTYQPQIDPSFRPNESVKRSEPFTWGPWIVNLIDTLSVPGTLLAVQGAAGVVCCHSAICLAAWHMNKPVFLSMPERYYRGLTTVDDKFSFGRDFKNTFHMQHEEFSQAYLRCWLEKTVSHGR